MKLEKKERKKERKGEKRDHFTVSTILLLLFNYCLIYMYTKFLLFV